MSIAEYGGKRVSMLTAGFNNFAGQTLGDFDGFGQAAAFRYQSRNVRAGTQKSPALQSLHSYADGYFFNARQMHLSFHMALRYE